MTLKGDGSKLAEYKAEELFGIAFPFIEVGEKQVQVQTGNIIYQSLREGIVYAAVMQSSIMVDDREPVLQVNLWLSTTVH